MSNNFYVRSTAFFRALATFESNDNDKAIGKAGEVSAFQILPKTWVDTVGEHIPCNKYNAERRDVAVRVARQHINKLIKQYREERNTLPTPGELYIMYNCGYDGFKAKGFSIENMPKKVRDRVSRFLNILDIKTKER